MAVRVKLKVERGSKGVETIALVNSGFETETPQLLIPVSLAKLLELWPPAAEVEEVDYEATTGPVRLWLHRGPWSLRYSEQLTR